MLLNWVLSARAQTFPEILGLTPAGILTWSNAVAPGVCTVEFAMSPLSGWSPLINRYATGSVGSVSFPLQGSVRAFRLNCIDLLPTTQGFTNWVNAYGALETVCGDGVGREDGVSYWQPQFEGGLAVHASLSRPHYAMADAAGRIYIVDKNSHSVLRVDRDGTIHTHAGTHEGGYNGDGPMTATNMELNLPNAIWVQNDGRVYVLDTDNARVRRVTTNGIATTLFNAKSDPSTPLGGGRCLWVKEDETLAYFGNGDRIRKWTPAGGVETLAENFTELGGLYVEASGSLLVTDRGANRVYRVFADGSRVPIAGNGSTSGGGNGQLALETGFYGPRGVWAVPTGGYLLLLHDGAKLWFIDANGFAYLVMSGLGGNNFVHGGDGLHFYAPESLNIGEGRSVCLDSQGNIIICESDYGFVRRVPFLRMIQE